MVLTTKHIKSLQLASGSYVKKNDLIHLNKRSKK